MCVESHRKKSWARVVDGVVFVGLRLNLLWLYLHEVTVYLFEEFLPISELNEHVFEVDNNLFGLGDVLLLKRLANQVHLDLLVRPGYDELLLNAFKVLN
jgi:hypothetical protein